MSDGARWEGLLQALRFQKVCEAGRKYRGGCLSIYLISSPDGISRAGISVGRHVGNAVKRNRAKRLIREAVRLNRERVRCAVWLVIVAKKGIVGAVLSKVEADLIELLEKAGVCR